MEDNTMFYTKDKRYTVELDMFITADNDYHARMIAHKIKKAIKDGYDVEIRSIIDTPFASFNTRKLDDISKPRDKDEDKSLPF